MKKLRKVGIVIAVLLVVIIALPFFISLNSFRPKLESELTRSLARQVKIGNLGLSIVTFGVGADDLSIADDPSFSQSPFVHAKSLKVGVELAPLIFSRTLHVTSLTLEEPEIILLHNSSGKWNFSSLGGKSDRKTPNASTSSNDSVAESVSISKLTVTNGRLSIAKAHGQEKPRVYDKVNIEVRDFSYTSQFPFTLTASLPGGGDLKFDGKAGPINAADASLTPFAAGVKVHSLDLARSGLIDPASGIAGFADFDGTATSDGNELRSAGTVSADKLKLAVKGSPASRKVEVKYAANHNLAKQSGTLSQGDINIGKAIAHLTGNYRIEGDSTVLAMKLSGQAMAVDELLAMLPALGVQLPAGAALKGGTLSTTLDVDGPLDRLTTSGPIRLADTKLAGFDLGSKLAAIASTAGGKTGPDTLIQNFSANVHVAPDGVRSEAISLIVPALGEITGNGTISPSNALNFKMDAKLTSGSVLGGLTQLAGISGAAGSSLPFLIQGTTSDPKFLPDVRGLVGSRLKGLGSTNQAGQSPVDALTGLFRKKKQK